jgi:hypothetical protein
MFFKIENGDASGVILCQNHSFSSQRWTLYNTQDSNLDGSGIRAK